MKPHVNSLDPDFYLDVQQSAHTHKYQSHKYDRLFSSRSRSINYSLRGKCKNELPSLVMFEKAFFNSWICPLIIIRTKLSWVLPGPMPHSSTKFHGDPSRSFCVVLLINRQTNKPSLAKVTRRALRRAHTSTKAQQSPKSSCTNNRYPSSKYDIFFKSWLMNCSL